MKRPTIREAAQQLHVCDRKLYAALRKANVIGSNNIALPKFQREGYFVNEFRGYWLRGTRIERQYTASTVTEKGMSLLQEIIDAEIREGRELRIGHATHPRAARAG